MHQLPKYILWPVTLVLGFFLIFSGCTVAKKPEQPQEKTPKVARSINAPNNTPTSQNQDYPREVAERVVNQANQVAGVQNSAAVIAGNTVYLGLELQENVDPKQARELEKVILQRFNEPHYTLMVSSDTATVAQIKRVSQGLAQGKPIDSYQEEIRDIGNRLKPGKR